MDSLFGMILDLTSWRVVLMSVLLAYVLTQAIAAVYAWTYRGLSYSRQLVQALVVAGVVSAMLMLAIGNSLARGIGIVGTLALIRFRTNLRDPLDMLFVFAAFGAGIAAGTGSYATGVIGTMVFLLVIGMLRWTGFGSQQQFEGVLRLQLPMEATAEDAVQRVLRQLCHSFALITLREVAQGAGQERAYQITLKQPTDESRLVAELAGIPGASGVTIALQEATVEL